MYICININSRVTELYHTSRSIEDERRLLRVKIQNEKGYTSKSREDVRSDDKESVKDCQSSLSNLRNKTHPGNTSHTLWHSHTRYKAMFHGAVRPGRCGLATFGEVEGRLVRRLDQLEDKLDGEERPSDGSCAADL